MKKLGTWYLGKILYNQYIYIYIDTHILQFKGLPLFGFPFFFFWVQKCPTPLYLSRDKTKGQAYKNTILTPTKTLPKK